MKLKNRIGERWSVLSRFDIPNRHNPDVTYLRRWYIIQTPWFGILLHKILEADSDYHMHDHPWNFLNIILKGSYIEQIPGKFTEPEFKLRKRFSLGYKQAEDRHSITRIFGPHTWTLLFIGRRRREWGFYTEDGWLQWEEYFERF